MSVDEKFEFGEILAATEQLKQDLRGALVQSEDSQVIELLRDVDDVKMGAAGSDAPPLAIAFVGQYNAGKSTLLKVLTGRRDIVIDSNVCTENVTAYDWKGVCLLDTPGIHAGYLDHDDKTYSAIDRADLLVFVITNELFDDTIGCHFRELAFARQHAKRMLLVVNKMAQDSGTPQTKLVDIEKVTSPFSAADFGTVFIDARSWLEAQSSSPSDRNDLLEIANLPAFTSALNEFVRDRGLTGRLSSPLFLLRGIAEQGRAILSTDFPEERAALELLYRKRVILHASRSRLRSAMGGVIARVVTDISTYGDEVAEAIEPGKTEEDVEALNADAQRRAKARSETLSTEAQSCIESEFAELRRQLEALRDGVLARELRGQASDDTSGEASSFMKEFEAPAWNNQTRKRVIAEWPTQAKKIAQIADEIGSWAAKWAVGPMAEGAAAGSSTAARGSQAHQVVYNVGKFFGVKFQPWGAVKVARMIGNAGRVIAAIGGVLAVVAQIAEDRQQDQYRIQLRSARDGVRSAYRDAALTVQAQFWTQFEAFLLDFYSSELSALDGLVETLTGKHSERRVGAGAFEKLAKRAALILDKIGDKAWTSSGLALGDLSS
nr:GTPase [uncultured Rhodopila sp.]